MPDTTGTNVEVALSAAIFVQFSQDAGNSSNPASATGSYTIKNGCNPISNAHFAVTLRASDGLEQVIGALAQPTLVNGTTSISVRDADNRPITFSRLSSISYVVKADDPTIVEDEEVAAGTVTIAITDICGVSAFTAQCVVGDFGAFGAPQWEDAIPVSSTAEIRVIFAAGSNLAVQFLVSGNYE